MTINKVCGSGLKAVALASQAIQTGDSTLVVAGGMESMTNAPYLLPQARKGLRLGDSQIVDSMIHDGLWDVYNDYHMGITGENVAEKYGITREEQDEFAVNSHRKAVSAIKECRFKSQVVPVELPAKKKGAAPVIFDKDESSARRHHHRNPALAQAGFQKRWNGHRRQCSGSKRWRGRRGRDQRRQGKRTRRKADGAHRRPGHQRRRTQMGHDGPGRRGAQDLGEDGMEERRRRSLRIERGLLGAGAGSDARTRPRHEKVNVNGGAVAIGHPIGASGARVLVTLIYEMIRRDVHRGIAALCLGGGNAVAMAVER